MQNDDELIDFEARGVDLPAGGTARRVAHEGASIWFMDYPGDGPAVVLLHGGLGHSGNFGKQVPALTGAGYRTVVIDSRGHGRSTRDERPYSYQLMAADVRAVMDRLGIGRAIIVGWSDGADIGLVMAHDTPERVAGLFYFACNFDSTGTRPFEFTPILGHCIARHKLDYAALSATPDDFEAFSAAVGEMQRTQPEYDAGDLARIHTPVLSVLGEHDEFIKREHAEALAAGIAGAEFVMLEGVSHFAPIQQPARFNAVMLGFLARVSALG